MCVSRVLYPVNSFHPPFFFSLPQVFLLSSVLGTGYSCVPLEAMALCVAPLRPGNAAPVVGSLAFAL